MNKYIQKIQNNENLMQSEIEAVMHEIMSGEAKPQDIADFLMI